MLRTALLSLFAAAVISADWLRLEHGPHGNGRVAILVLLAVAPALLRRPLRVVALPVATIAAIGVAFSLRARTLWPYGGDFFGRFGSRFGSGFVDFYAYRLPIDPGAHPRMHMLLLLAVFVFGATVALAVAARRPVAAVAFFVIGAGWPATLLAGGGELVRGLTILLVALVLLGGLTERAGVLAAPAVVVAVAFALALSSSPAVAKSALLDWQHWNPYVRQPKSVSVSYVWNSNYAGLHFPNKRTTVLTITAPSTIGTYWRATVLDEFVHDHWVEHLWRESPAVTKMLAPAAAANPAGAVRQEVLVGALRDRHLIAASIPLAYNVDTPATYAGQYVASTRDGLRRGERYVAWSFAAQPTPADLVRSPAAYPQALTKDGRELELAPRVNAPPFGTRDRDAILSRRLTGPLAPYRQLFALAQRVAGDTQSPYAAVVALERWFRTTGGFTYSEQPPQIPGVPPLVAFALETRNGYCQHYAGAMALMVRLLGIPARVAAGFVNGHYASGRWTITDHDAHTWVEVWFPGYGWLPFDPTPGRGELAAPYSDASPRFDAAAAAKLLAHLVRGGEVFNAPKGGGGPEARLPVQRPGAAAFGALSTPAPSGGHHSLLRFVALILLCVVLLISAAKFVRRRVRYISRDPRRISAACARELADFLADQRIALAQGSTIREIGEQLDRRFAVNASSFTQAVETARFGPPTAAAAAAATARAELTRLKVRLRRRLGIRERIRGSVSLRSLGFS